MNKSDRLLKAIGLISIGALAGKLFNNYVIPLCEIKMSRVQNDFTKESTELQEELYAIQERSAPVSSNVVGFIQPEYEEEHEEDYE